MPAVSLDQLRIFRLHQKPCQMRILGKLRPDNLLHLPDPDILPVGPHRDVTPQSFGIVGIQFRKTEPVLCLCTLGRLKGCLGTKIFQSVHPDTSRVVVAQIVIFQTKPANDHFHVTPLTASRTFLSGPVCVSFCRGTSFKYTARRPFLLPILPVGIISPAYCI